MKGFAQLFVVGFAGIAAFKVFGGLALPLLGMLFGLMGFALKMIVIGAIVYFVLQFFKDRKRERYVD